MKYRSVTLIVAFVLAWIGWLPPSRAAEVPTIVSPVAQRGEAPTRALPAHAKRVGAVSFNISALQPPAGTRVAQADAWMASRLRFKLFPDVSFDAEGSRIAQDDFGNTTWVGKIDGVEDGVVTLTTKGNTLVGRIDLGLSQYLLTGSAADGFWVSEIDPASCRSAYDGDTAEFLDALTSPRPAATSNGFMLNGASSGHTVDVLVLYSTHALFQMGLDPSTFVANLTSDNDQSFINSNVDGAVRVVGYAGISGFTEPIVSGSGAYTEFTNIRNAMLHGTGYFSRVPGLLTQY